MEGSSAFIAHGGREAGQPMLSVNATGCKGVQLRLSLSFSQRLSGFVGSEEPRMRGTSVRHYDSVWQNVERSFAKKHVWFALRRLCPSSRPPLAAPPSAASVHRPLSRGAQLRSNEQELQKTANNDSILRMMMSGVRRGGHPLSGPCTVLRGLGGIYDRLIECFVTVQSVS